MVHGGPAHVLDDTKVIRECWDELESKTIPDCWTRSCFLLVYDLGDIASIQKQLIQAGRGTGTHTCELFEVKKIASIVFLVSYFISLGFNLTSIFDQSLLRNVGLAETTAATGPDRKKIILLNLEENKYVIDAESTDLFSQPISLNLNSPSKPLIMYNSNQVFYLKNH